MKCSLLVRRYLPDNSPWNTSAHHTTYEETRFSHQHVEHDRLGKIKLFKVL